MKKSFLFAAALLLSAWPLAAQESFESVVTGAEPQLKEGPFGAKSTGTQGHALTGFSEGNGQSGIYAVQRDGWEHPTVYAMREATGNVAVSGTIAPVIYGYDNTPSATPYMVLQVGGCALVSGDNWLLGNSLGQFQAPGGITDGGGTTIGNVALHPRYRQGLAEDGVTVRFAWSSGTFAIGCPATVNGNLAITGTLVSGVVPAANVAPLSAASLPTSGTNGQIIVIGGTAAYVRLNGAWKVILTGT